MKRSIALLGFMGCGKSTVAKRLAEIVGYDFIDLDTIIEKKNNKTTPEIFAEGGEDLFRKKEREALEDVIKFQICIIATGGGAPCFFDNMELINRYSRSIYIKCSVDTLISRLSTSRTERPLIKGKSRSELKSLIEEMITAREPYYSKADIIIDSDNMETAKDVAEAIQQELLKIPRV